MKRNFFVPVVDILEDRAMPATVSLLFNSTLIRFTPGENISNVLYVSTTEEFIQLIETSEEFVFQGVLPNGWMLSEDKHELSIPRGNVEWIQCINLGPESDFVYGAGCSIALDFQGGDGDDTLEGGSANDRLNSGAG